MGEACLGIPEQLGEWYISIHSGQPPLAKVLRLMVWKGIAENASEVGSEFAKK